MELLCSGYGQYDSKLKTGDDYPTLDFDGIVGIAANPPTVDKTGGQWIIPSNYNRYDARQRKAQRDHGSYPLLWADIDEGNPTFESVVYAMRSIVGANVKFLVYSTASSTKDKNKFRVLLPLDPPIPGREAFYEAAATVLNDALVNQGLHVDRVTQGPNQLCYLPNPQDRDSYIWYLEPGEPFNIEAHRPFMERVIPTAEALLEKSRSTEQAPKVKHGYRGLFNDRYPIDELMALAGFHSNNGGRDWHHPNQTGKSYSTRVWDDGGWTTQSTTVASWFGRNWGDSFDLFLTFWCQGDEKLADRCAHAIPYGWQIGEDPQAALDYHRMWGNYLFSHMRVSGVAVGPELIEKIEREARLASDAIVEQIVDSPVPLSEGEWTIPFPPGKMGELITYTHSQSVRPVTQYSIAFAFWFMSAIAGRRYLVSRTGLGLYFVLGGMTGSGKGQAWSAVRTVISKLGEMDGNPAVQEIFKNSVPASGPGLRNLLGDGLPIKAIYKSEADALLTSLAMEFGLGQDLRSNLIEVWDISGAGAFLGSTRYSKKENNVEAVERPCLSVMLDTQVAPLKVFLGTAAAMHSGLGTRMLMIEYDGNLKYTTKPNYRDPPEQLMQTILNIWQPFRLNPNEMVNVGWEPDAERMHDHYDRELTDRINRNTTTSGFLNRIGMNIARIAALMALMENPHNPVITVEQWKWSKLFCEKCSDRIIQMVLDGETGGGEAIRVMTAVKAIYEYPEMDKKARLDHKVPPSIVMLNKVIPEHFLKHRLKVLSPFKGTDNGKTREKNVEDTIAQMLKDEQLEVCSREYLAKEYGVILGERVTLRIFRHGPSWDYRGKRYDA